MNTHGYHITNDAVAAHHAWVLPELTDAMAADGTMYTVRTSVARALVRAGAWMLPSRPRTATDGIHVLPKPTVRTDVQRAA